MAGREEMLRRIRGALGWHESASGREQILAELFPPLEQITPVIPSEELASKFEAEFLSVGGCHYRARDRNELDDILGGLLADRPAVVLSRNPVLVKLNLRGKLEARGIAWTGWPAGDAGPGEAQQTGEFREQCFRAGVGVTGVDFALAETGTLVLTSVSEGSQLASLAPPVHVAFYRRSQLVASLEEVLQGLPVPPASDAQAPGRSAVFVTGTSRTADIEQILVRGVHGPREVHAILAEEACFPAGC